MNLLSSFCKTKKCKCVRRRLFRSVPFKTDSEKKECLCVCVRRKLFRSVQFLVIVGRRKEIGKWQLNRRMSEFSPSRFTSLLLAYNRYFFFSQSIDRRTHCEINTLLGQVFELFSQISEKITQNCFSKIKK